MTGAVAVVPARTHSLGVAAACALGNIFGLSTILYMTFSLFLVPVTTALGWTRAELSFSLTIISVIDLFAYPLAGILMDRIGARPVLLIGNLVFGLSVMALSLIGGGRVVTYLLFAAIGLTAALPSTVIISRVLSTWFTERRGLALAICSGMAFGVGGTLTATIAQWMIAHHGWRQAYLLLGALPIVIVLPLMALFVRDAPVRGVVADPGVPGNASDPTLGQAIRTRAFILLLIPAMLASAAIHVVSTHVAVFLASNGLTGAIAAGAISSIVIATAVWQLVLGAIFDRVASPRVAGLFLIVAAIGMMLIFGAHTRPVALLGCILLGIGSGTEFGLLPYCLSRYFGLRHYGLIYGCMFGCVAFSIGLSPFLLDLIYGATGDYAPTVHGSAVVLSLCGALFLFLPRFPDPAGEAR